MTDVPNDPTEPRPLDRAPGPVGRLLNGAAAVTQFFCTALMVVMTVIISWQIFGRFILNNTPKWSEQLAGVLMVYLTLLGGAIAVKEGRHIALTYFRDRFPVKLREAAWVVCHLLVLGFGLIMLVYGAKMAQLVQAWTIPTLGVSTSVNYWPFPVSGALIVAFSAQALVRAWRNTP
ncbi:TRAP transporter small permease [Marinihelvus fidelis]|nr:TRAP transporter small permease [Marinihelvus fidelis]